MVGREQNLNQIRLAVLAFLYNDGWIWYQYTNGYRESKRHSHINVTEVTNKADDPRKVKYYLEIIWDGMEFQEFLTIEG